MNTKEFGKQGLVAYLKLLSQDSSGDTKENHEYLSLQLDSKHMLPKTNAEH